MGAGALSRGAIAIVALAPGLGWYVAPTSPVLALIVATLAVAAALHGLGRMVAHGVGDPDAPTALVIAWGAALYLGVGGALVAAGAFPAAVQRVVLVAGTAWGAAWLTRHPPKPGAFGPALLLPVFVAIVVLLHIAGAAGDRHGAFFDGDVIHLGALRRLELTGGLGDAFGVPRLRGLGGDLVLGTLAMAFDGITSAHVVDRGLALGLTAALVFALVERGALRGLVLVAVVGLMSAVPAVGPDLAPRWTVVALLVAIHLACARARARGAPPWGALVLAVALATIVHVGLAAMLVVVGATVRSVPAGPARRRAALAAAAIVGLGLGGLVIAALAAHAAAVAAPGLAVAPPNAAFVIGAAAAGGLGYVLLIVVTRPLDDRDLHATIAIAFAMIAAVGLVPSIGGVPNEPIAVGIALGLLVLTRALMHHETPIGMIAIVAVIAGLAAARTPAGSPPRPWGKRLGRELDHAREGAPHTPLLAVAYRDAFASIPRGVRVGLWVARPDLALHDRADLVDLRSGVGLACVGAIARNPGKAARPCARFERLLTRLDLDALVVAPAALPYLVEVDPITRRVGRERLERGPELLVIDLRAR